MRWFLLLPHHGDTLEEYRFRSLSGPASQKILCWQMHPLDTPVVYSCPVSALLPVDVMNETNSSGMQSHEPVSGMDKCWRFTKHIVPISVNGSADTSSHHHTDKAVDKIRCNELSWIDCQHSRRSIQVCYTTATPHGT